MISLVTNADSLIAQQNLRVNSQFQSKTIQQLTSGYRINSSGDDAAGLAVANSYRNSIAQLTQGVRNANDGVSQLQIIDGGLGNISQMLDRLQTLATQSASQTFTGDRTTLNNEYQSLLAEIDRQANNIGLGDQNSANAVKLSVYIGGGQSAEANSTVSVDLNAQSVSSTGLGLLGTSVLGTAAVTVGSAAAVAIAAGHTDTFYIATAAGDQTITIKGQTGDTIQGQLNQLNAQLSGLGITASLDNNGKLQFQSASAFTVDASTDNTSADLVAASSGTHDTAVNKGLNNQSYTWATGDSLTIQVGSASVTVAAAAMTGNNQATVDAINQALSSQGITGVTAVLDETTAGGAPTGISLQGASTFTASVANAGTAGTLGTYTKAADGGDATAAINAVAQAVKNLGQVSGVVGAGENTLAYAINLAQSQISSFSAAQSQIRDADVAAQAANLTKAQVLQQASIAAMAQANAEPQAILALLKA